MPNMISTVSFNAWLLIYLIFLSCFPIHMIYLEKCISYTIYMLILQLRWIAQKHDCVLIQTNLCFHVYTCEEKYIMLSLSFCNKFFIFPWDILFRKWWINDLNVISHSLMILFDKYLEERCMFKWKGYYIDALI